jgi:Carboxypeptidase regulatory-like domain
VRSRTFSRIWFPAEALAPRLSADSRHGKDARMTRLDRLKLRRALALLLFALPLTARAQEPVPVRPGSAPPTGSIGGIVRDPMGVPVVGAIVTVEGSARQSRSDEEGRFAMTRVMVGIQEISIRRIGYRPTRAQIPVRADSATMISVTLIAEPQALPGVVVEEQLLNQLGGVVVDENFRPVEGAMVDIVGLRRGMRTDADGRFVFVDLAPGNYLVEVRAEGYAQSRRAVQMVAHIERDLAIRLRPADAEDRSMEFLRVVAEEADRRKAMAGARATFVGAAELAKWENAPLIVALMGSSGGIAMRELAQRGRGGRLSRQPTSIDRGGSQGRGQASAGNVLSCVLIDGFETNGSDMLGFLRASEVELVEIFPEGADNSRTLCGRFPPSSGCSCPPEPAGIVVWLKK